jgi:hypothetical protein
MNVRAVTRTRWFSLMFNPWRDSSFLFSCSGKEGHFRACAMALVTTNGSGWGTLTTTGAATDKPLPNCLARLVQNKNGVRFRCACML